MSRADVLADLAQRIIHLPLPHPVRVAIDGGTASGKTTIADELAAVISRSGRAVIRTSIDGFHRPKIERYARGRHSAEGYYYDARDLGAVVDLLLEPLGPNGGRHYRTASFDLEQDRPIEQMPAKAAKNAILIVDGTFLQRPELRGHWDATVFVRTSPEISEERGLQRDAERLGGLQAVQTLYSLRYRPAYALYESLCRPENASDVIVDNNDLTYPTLAFKSGGRLEKPR